MADNYIEVKDVVKQYDGHLAVDRVSLAVPRGSIYGLLGPNGAGKTSLLRIINMITAPDSGEVLLDGRPMRRDDVMSIGYLPEERGLYKKMKVGDHIVYLARLKGLKRVEAINRMEWWLDHMNLGEWRNRKVEDLSKGMQQKVQFISTVLHEPPLLIFDEPFSGFDPVNAEQLKQEILRLRDAGATILFSTHNMASVEEVCERFTLINKSRVVLEGSVADVKQQYKRNELQVGLGGGETLAEAPALYRILESGKGHAVISLQEGVALRDVVAHINETQTLVGFNELLPSMNDIFISVVTQGQGADVPVTDNPQDSQAK